MGEIIPNKVRDSRSYQTEFINSTIDTWLVLFERNRLILDAQYQRDYVWGEREQQGLLKSIVAGIPLNVIAVVKDNNDFEYEVVDGKQRLTTLQLFFNDRIKVDIDGDKFLFSELNSSEQNTILNFSLPMVILKNADEKTRIKYFLSINFGGVPQSDEHHEKVLKMLRESEMAKSKDS